MEANDTLFPNLVILDTRRVYFGLGVNGLIKIGVTGRKSGHRGGELHFTELCSVRGGRSMEEFYHQKYAAERIGKTEWFNDSDRLILDLIEMCSKQGIDWAVATLKALLLRRLRKDAA